MHEEGSGERLARLEAEVLSDPGSAGFPALAELHRREGRLAEAEAVARAGLAVKPDVWEGRVSLALALLDQGRSGEAHEQLERAVGDGLAARGLPTEPAAELPVDEAFATETMAELLERQGDRAGAERIRASLDEGAEAEPARPAASSAAEGGARPHIIHELERWLGNARRMGERA